jgi:hypothetical protein
LYKVDALNEVIFIEVGSDGIFTVRKIIGFNLNFIDQFRPSGRKAQKED